jgi:hypothetical protein
VSEGIAMVAAVIADMRARGISMEGDCGAWGDHAPSGHGRFGIGEPVSNTNLAAETVHENSIDIGLFTDGRVSTF